MNITKLTIFSCLLLVSSHGVNAFSPKRFTGEICSFFFGQEDASKDIKKLAKQARDEFQISKTDRLPVKYIAWLKQFISFTWFGSWFNKEEWSKLSEHEKTFTVYHEVAHEKCNHPIKQVGVALSTLAGSIFLGRTCLSGIKNTVLRRTLYLALTAGLLGTIVPWYARSCEKDADTCAAQVLCANGKEDVVKSYVNDLRSLEPDKNAWFFFNSTEKQIVCLQAIVGNKQ